MRVSILVIGDEILDGFVEDTNSSWLARQLQPTAVALDRIATIRDEISEIGEVLQSELLRTRPRVVVTTGGVGSTPDDMTYEAVATALNRPLVEHPVIAERIEASLVSQAEFGGTVSEEQRWHMMRMARVPAGSQLLDEKGEHPGVRLDIEGGIDAGGAAIMILPGVPSQFRLVVQELVIPELIDRRGVASTVVEIQHGLPESVLNPIFARAGENYPEVKLGSYPGLPMRIRLSGPPDLVEEAATFVRGELAGLMATDAGAQLAADWTRRLAADEEHLRSAR